MYAMTGTPTPATHATDRAALTSVQWAAIVALVGVVVSLVTLFSGSYSSLIGVTTVNGSSTLTVSSTALYFLILAGGAGLVLTIVELFLYRSAFRALAPVDSEFSTPATLVLLLFIGLVLVIAIAVGLVGILLQSIACAGAGNPITTSCLNVGTLLDLVGLLVVAAIVALIGYIGLLVGIWRLGTRYNESLFKVGAVLMFFPVLNFIGVVLVLVGAHSALSRLRPMTPGPTTFG
jgi:hypothetical protein